MIEVHHGHFSVVAAIILLDRPGSALPLHQSSTRKCTLTRTMSFPRRSPLGMIAKWTPNGSLNLNIRSLMVYATLGYPSSCWLGEEYSVPPPRITRNFESMCSSEFISWYDQCWCNVDLLDIEEVTDVVKMRSVALLTNLDLRNSQHHSLLVYDFNMHSQISSGQHRLFTNCNLRHPPIFETIAFNSL